MRREPLTISPEDLVPWRPGEPVDHRKLNRTHDALRQLAGRFPSPQQVFRPRGGGAAGVGGPVRMVLIVDVGETKLRVREVIYSDDTPRVGRYAFEGEVFDAYAEIGYEPFDYSDLWWTEPNPKEPEGPKRDDPFVVARSAGDVWLVELSKRKGRLARIIAITGDVLTMRPVRLNAEGEVESFGEHFAALAWPDSAGEDYAKWRNAPDIFMVERWAGGWFVTWKFRMRPRSAIGPLVACEEFGD